MSRQQISDDQRAALEALEQDIRHHAQLIEDDALTPAGYGDLREWADRLAAALSGSSTAPGEAVTMANVGIAAPASVVATVREAPICAACAGKGWVSPEDAERGIQENGEMFTAGYEHRKQHFEAAAGSSAEPADLLASCKELHHILLGGMQEDYDDMTAALGRARIAIEQAEAAPASPRVKALRLCLEAFDKREALLERMRFVANASATDSFGNARAVATEIRQWVAALDRGDKT